MGPDERTYVVLYDPSVDFSNVLCGLPYFPCVGSSMSSSLACEKSSLCEPQEVDTEEEFPVKGCWAMDDDDLRDTPAYGPGTRSTSIGLL